MTRSTLRRCTPKPMQRGHCQSRRNLAVGHCVAQCSPHDQLLVLHASRSLTASPQVPSTLLQVLQGVQVQQGPLVPVYDHLLHQLVQ